jgi:hypothetical protein
MLVYERRLIFSYVRVQIVVQMASINFKTFRDLVVMKLK